MNSKIGSDIPLGLGMALMQNSDAYTVFAALEAEMQQRIIDGAKAIESREEMRNYVAGIPSTL